MERNFVYSSQEELVKYLINNSQKDSLHAMIGLGLSNTAFIKRLLKREPLDLDYILMNIENILADYKEMNAKLIEIKQTNKPKGE